ncbi:hypothetical protein EYF80_054117 [Liparis tanakae]|uniref:Uncharacterized protein n=1 Tax=Liparis tanakae TaxID=230148 RepID=A0A4Z2F3D0_9TELE|nr:hypothetical protein EYF80_054117 [Liparis tanakae]
MSPERKRKKTSVSRDAAERGRNRVPRDVRSSSRGSWRLLGTDEGSHDTGSHDTGDVLPVSFIFKGPDSGVVPPQPVPLDSSRSQSQQQLHWTSSRCGARLIHHNDPESQTSGKDVGLPLRSVDQPAGVSVVSSC